LSFDSVTILTKRNKQTSKSQTSTLRFETCLFAAMVIHCFTWSSGTWH